MQPVQHKFKAIHISTKFPSTVITNSAPHATHFFLREARKSSNVGNADPGPNNPSLDI